LAFTKKKEVLNFHELDTTGVNSRAGDTSLLFFIIIGAKETQNTVISILYILALYIQFG